MYFICSFPLGEGQQHSFSGIPAVAQNSKEIPPELNEHLVIGDRGAATLAKMMRTTQISDYRKHVSRYLLVRTPVKNSHTLVN